MDIRSVLLMRVSSEVDKDVDHPQFFDPSYPLKYLQAALRKYKDCRVSLLDCWIRPMNRSEMLAYVKKLKPDLVVVSSSSFDINVAIALAAGLKQQPPPPFLVGIGQGFYLARDQAGQGIDALQPDYDAVLLGEPEEEFFKLFEWMRNGSKSCGNWRKHYKECYADGKRFYVNQPDLLPFPSYTPQELAIYKSIYPVKLSKKAVWGYLIASRGCPHQCMFCSEVMRVSVGTLLRSRSAVNVADEMQHLKGQGVNICSFQDDSFSANRGFVRDLCTELIERDLQMPWMARVRADELSYELLGLMKQAGCTMLGIGVESGTRRVVEQMHKRHRPGPWLDICRRVFTWTRQLDIGTNAYYVIGNPGETADEIQATIRFALELNADSIQVHFYTPYPGSPAWRKYHRQLSNCDPADMFHYAAPPVSLAKVSPEELVKLRSTFYRRYLFRPAFALQHLKRYAGFYLHNPDVFMTLLGIGKIL